MPFEKEYDLPEPIEHAPCALMRSKAMYVTGRRTPNHADEEGSHYCWCNLTQHVRGPDQEHVDRQICIAGRGCFRDTYEV